MITIKVSIFLFSQESGIRDSIFKARIFNVTADLTTEQMYMITGKSWSAFSILNKAEVPFSKLQHQPAQIQTSKDS